MFKLLLGLVLLTSMIEAGSRVPKKFPIAKKIAIRLYAINHNATFYTDSNISIASKVTLLKFPRKPRQTLFLKLNNSPYDGDSYKSRGTKVEWEHVVPASWMVTADETIKTAWVDGDEKCVTSGGTKYKGRKCAEKVSDLFNEMESDLKNLVPIIGALNAIRSDKNYGIIDGEEREFGDTIDVEINKTTIEVSEDKRGDVARIMLYMQDTYGILFPDNDNTVKMLKKWSEDDKIDEWEKKKNDILHDIYPSKY